MPNPYVNKVQKSNGDVLIDLSTDTVSSAADIVSGKVGHLRDGTRITGALVIQHYYTGSSAPSSSLGQNGDIYLQT